MIYTELEPVTPLLLFNGLSIVSTEAASFHQFPAVYSKEVGLHLDEKYSSFFQFIHIFFCPLYHDHWAAATLGSKQTPAATPSSAQQGALTEN